MRTVRLLLASWVVMLTVTAPDFVTPDSRVLAQEPQRHIDPDADRILREMGEYLAAAAAFTFQADSSMDSVLRSGQWVTVGARSHIAAQRPDQLRVERHGDERHRRVVLNEGRFTMYDSERNVYAVADVPTAIDEAIDHMVETFGFSVPLSDLLAPNPYETLIANVETGFVVGRHAVDGVPCHHLAFSQEWIDWEVWIEDGPRPVPRQVIITYKDEEGAPGYAVRLSNWDFRPGFSDHYFEFQPPPGSDSIEFLPTREEIQP